MTYFLVLGRGMMYNRDADMKVSRRREAYP